MKTFTDTFKIVFLAIGTIVGAGFISGAELIGFFGLDGFAPFVILSGLLYFLCLYSVLYFGKKQGGFKGITENVFSGKKTVYYLSLFSLFISFSAMLSGIDEVWNGFNVLNGYPVFSLPLLLIMCFTAKFGIKGLEKFNAVFSPLIFIATTVILIKTGNCNFGGIKISLFKPINAFLFVTSNTFLSLPVLSDCAENKSGKSIFLSPLIISLLLTVFGLFILGVINGNGGIYKNSEIPLLGSVGGEYYILFISLLFVGITTSLFTMFYPLYGFCYKDKKKSNVFLLCLFSFLFSRLGISTIVKYAYPVIGALGTYCMIKFARYFYNEKRYKKLSLDDNINKRSKK